MDSPTNCDPFEELTAAEDRTDHEYPAYGTKGYVIVEVLQKIDIPYHPGWEWEIDRYTYDSENSTFWLSEGMGIDYFINNFIGEDIPGPGIWMIEDVVGHYYKGDWGFTDDDEKWEWGTIRPATPDEIAEL